MRFQIQYVVVICWTILLSGSACSGIDAPSEPGARPAQDVVDSAGADKALAGKGDAAATSLPEACEQRLDCPERAHAARWCSPDGECRYACESGYGTGGGRADVVGCECGLSNGGREICDGIDDDCDGVVDNPLAGGQIAAGGYHTCATDAEGVLRCWGDLVCGTVAGSEDATFWQVETGRGHGCALAGDGAAYCWGDNTDGQLGAEAGRGTDEPTLVSEELRFVDLAVGAAHTCGVTFSGIVYCWGQNDYGQLGDGTTTQRDEPVRVAAGRQDFADVTAGDFHTCAARTNGDVLCWGANILGQVGRAGDEMVVEPRVVDVPEALVFIEAGANHTCGLTGQGRAYCWGNNSYGQLGDGTRYSRAQPRQVEAETAFLAMNLGTTHTCAIARGGRMYCWGSNVNGQLGSEAASGRALRPVSVDSEVRFVDVAVAEAHSCGLSRQGHLYCWGDGSRNQLSANAGEVARTPQRSDCL